MYVKKNLNIVVNNSIIYTSDNLGFVYAYDYINKKVYGLKIIRFHFDQT